MKGLLKLLGGIIAILVIAIVIAVIVIPMVVDPNDYKGEITALVKKQTGRELEIPGDLSITVFPWLGVKTGELSFSNAEGFGDEPMVRARGIEARVKLLPLLRKEIEMGTVVIDSLQANLARDAGGRTNWDDLVKAAEVAEAEPDPEVRPDADEQPGFALAGLALGGLDISNSRLSWTDEQAGQRYIIDDLNLETGALVPGEPVKLDLSMAIDASEPALKGTLALAGTVSYDIDNQRYRITPLRLKSDLEGPQLPGGGAAIDLRADNIAADLGASTASIKAFSLKALDTVVEGDIDAQNIDSALPALKGFIKVSGDNLPGLLAAAGQDELAGKVQRDARKFSLNASFDADAEAGTATLSELEGRVLGMELAGNLSATRTNTDNPGVNGELKLDGQDLRSLLAVAGQEPLAENLRALQAQLKFSGSRQDLKLDPLDLKATLGGEALPRGPEEVVLQASAGANLAAGTLSIPALSVQGLGLDVQGSVSAREIFGEPAFDGELEVSPFNLRELMPKLGMDVPETADKGVLTRVGVETRYKGTANSLNLSNLSLTLDDTRATGNVNVADLAKQALRFDLNVNQINADRYLPPPAEGKQPPATPETTAGAAAELPLETLRGLDIKGSLKVGELVISKAKLSNVSLTLDAANGVIALAPVSADLYKGNYRGAINLDAREDTPQLKFDTTLAGVDIEPLLNDMTGEAKLTGMANITANLQARGADAEAIKRTLNGTADMLFQNGAYKGINIGHILRRANAVLKGQSLSEVPEKEQTDFSEMTASLTIENGVIKNEDLSAKSPAIRVAGAGQANLVSEQIDYTVNASVAKTAEGQGGAGLDAVGGYTVPVRCQGTFAEPGCKPDLAGLAKARIDREVDKQKEKVEEKVKKKLEKELGEEAGKQLRDAFGF